ncbi:ATP-binding cassette domain-containing protein [Paracoccus sp. S-4012]|uniref:ABC transporter ATP-binding protein n=1 Tax=Paracoccus sp. S-4012 TaxID=2665648 RepID=UPI0012B0F86D|nr:ABC transporter ATP-binding protein [Paracoccus sp. S-4012]MRX52278.1 ATP-binding cassette domain-containing protein [Paracoccus sp. S-4012]
MNGRAPLLSVRDLVVRYGAITALDGVSLEVGEGEIVAIIGPNGAGKSTLLSTVAGLRRPDAGGISFAGTPIAGGALEGTVRRGIAYVPEGRHVFAGLTVLENLELGATVRRDRAEARAHLESFLDAFPILRERAGEAAGRLSGGEQQMLVIARGLLSKPRLLMLDEPSLGLAPKIVDQVYELVTSLRRDGLTVLVVEQNAGRALAAADRTYVLNAGRVRLQGRSAELTGAPDFDAAYFGLKD